MSRNEMYDVLVSLYRRFSNMNVAVVAIGIGAKQAIEMSETCTNIIMQDGSGFVFDSYEVSR